MPVMIFAPELTQLILNKPSLTKEFQAKFLSYYYKPTYFWKTETIFQNGQLIISRFRNTIPERVKSWLNLSLAEKMSNSIRSTVTHFELKLKKRI